MLRKFTDTIIFDMKKDYLKWLEYKDKLKLAGYKISETTIMTSAEKEYAPFIIENLDGMFEEEVE